MQTETHEYFTAYSLAATTDDPPLCALVTLAVPYAHLYHERHMIFHKGYKCYRLRDDIGWENHEAFKRTARPGHVALTSDSGDIYVKGIQCFEAKDARQIVQTMSGRRIEHAIGVDLKYPCEYRIGEKVKYTPNWNLKRPEYSVPFFLSPDAALFVPHPYDHVRPIARFEYPLPFSDSSRNRGIRLQYTQTGILKNYRNYGCCGYDFARGAYRIKANGATKVGEAVPVESNQRDDRELDRHDAEIGNPTYHEAYYPVIERIFNTKLNRHVDDRFFTAYTLVQEPWSDSTKQRGTPFVLITTSFQKARPCCWTLTTRCRLRDWRRSSVCNCAASDWTAETSARWPNRCERFWTKLE